MAPTRSIAAAIARHLPDDEDLTKILGMAHDHLKVDLVFISEFTAGRQIFRALQGDAESFGMVRNAGPPLEETYCTRMVGGTIPQVIPDTSTEPAISELAATRGGPIGAFIGVPLRFSDGRLFGTFCGLNHRADPRLTERDVAYLELLGLVLVERLERADRRRSRHEQIESALMTGDIKVALQPIVSLTDHEVTGAEALARFPKFGLPPDVVIEQAHDVGLGVEMELLAIRAALGRIDDVPPDAYLSVNIGPTALLSPQFTETIRRAPLARICVELTEHTSITEYADLLKTIVPLREDGLLLAVDDVGAGYSSLRHVLQLHPDILKIDRSLIDGIAEDRGRRSIVTSIVLLALDLGATVVAEGVETTQDRETLAVLGVDMMQGYLFARPSTEPSDWRAWSMRTQAMKRPTRRSARELRLDDSMRLDAAG